MENDKTIFRIIKTRENPFVMMDKRPLENPLLSYKAKGILAYLLSRPDNWEINLVDLTNRSTDGIKAVRTGIDELIAAGHVVRRAERDQTGRFKQWVLEVHEQPVPADLRPHSPFGDLAADPDDQRGDMADDPDTHFPQVEKPQVENGTQLILINTNTDLTNTTGAKSAPEPVEGEDSGVVKNVGALRAIAAFERTHQQGSGFENFPEDVRPVIERVCQLFGLKPPRKDAKKGGQFALWISDSRLLRDAMAEFGLEILNCVHQDWREGFRNGVPPFMVGRPGSLITVTRAKAGWMRTHHTAKPDEDEDTARAAAIHAEMLQGREKREREGFVHA